MENTIYIANKFADSLKHRPDDEQEQIADMIDSLAGDGWKNSEIASADGTPGGGLRARRSGNLSLLFRYAPEQNAIIVASVMPSEDYELATKGMTFPRRSTQGVKLLDLEPQDKVAAAVVIPPEDEKIPLENGTLLQ